MKYQDIAVAWIKTDKNGNTFLSVKASKDLKKGDNFNLFKNDKGGVEARPDYRAYEKVEEVEDQNEDTQEDISGDVPF